MVDRCFTPRSARKALVALRPAAETLCRLYRRIELARPERIQPDQPVDRVYFTLVARLHLTLDEIRRRGARVHDIRRGELEFPARRAGRAVVLCWQVGEATLGYWREAQAETHRRRPVDEDGPWDRA